MPRHPVRRKNGLPSLTSTLVWSCRPNNINKPGLAPAQAAQHGFQIVSVDGIHQSILAVDVSLQDKFHQRLFQAERTHLLTDRNLLMQMLESVAADMLSRRIIHDQQF